MVSFYGNVGGGGGTVVAPANVGITAKEGYSDRPIDLFTLPDGNYNLLGTVTYGNNVSNFLSYETFVIETQNGIKYASYDSLENGEMRKIIIKMTSPSAVDVMKVAYGCKCRPEDYIDDTNPSLDKTFSSNFIMSLLSWATS